MSDPFSLQMTSRKRKQRFPHPDRRRTSSFLLSGQSLRTEFDSVDFSEFARRSTFSSRLHSSTKRVRKLELNGPSSETAHFERRLRDEHNEQERSRRRELAVIYELIRCSFSQADLRHLGPGNAPKSIEKLSYPQVLQIAYHIIREENHNLQLFERTLAEIKQIEKEFQRAGLPLPARPPYPSITETYKKVVSIVDGLLKHDKAERNMHDGYNTTPAQLAALGDYQLDFLRPKHSQDCLDYSPPYGSSLSTSSVRLDHGLSSNSSRSKLSPRSSRLPSRCFTQRIPKEPAVSSTVSASQFSISDGTMSKMASITSSSSNFKCSLPRIGTVLKSDFDLVRSNYKREDDVLSSRTMQHSLTDSIEYVDELDLPPVAESLSLDEDLSFFGNPVQNGTFSSLDCPHIFPEMPL